MTISLEQGDTEEANQYFNTSLFGSVLIVLLLLIPAGLAAFYLDRLIELPAGQTTQARWLFICVAASFFLSAIQSAFAVSTFYMNRFDLRNLLGATQQVARVSVVVLLFSLIRPELYFVGLATLLSGCVGWGWSIRWWRKLTPTLHISLSHFNLRLKSMTSMGSWLSINYVGGMLFLAIDLLIVNRMFGPTAGGRYAAALQWSNLLRTIATVVVGAFVPTILYYYANQKIDSLVAYSRRAVKLVGLIVSLPIGLVCGLSRPLLTTWLGPDFADLSWLLVLLTLHMAITLPERPLYAIFTAVNRVRVPALVTIALGLCNLGLAITLAGPVGWGLYGVAVAGTSMFLVKNTLFVPVYAAIVLGRKPLSFLMEIIPISAATVVIVVAAAASQLIWDIHGWGRLIAVGVILSAVYLPVVYWIILNRDDRELAWSYFPNIRF